MNLSQRLFRVPDLTAEEESRLGRLYGRGAKNVVWLAAFMLPLMILGASVACILLSKGWDAPFESGFERSIALVGSLGGLALGFACWVWFMCKSRAGLDFRGLMKETFINQKAKDIVARWRQEKAMVDDH